MVKEGFEIINRSPVFWRGKESKTKKMLEEV